MDIGIERESSNFMRENENIDITEETNFAKNVFSKELDVIKDDVNTNQITSVIVDQSKTKNKDDMIEDSTDNAQSCDKVEDDSIQIDDLENKNHDKDSINLKELPISSQSTENIFDSLHLQDDLSDQEDCVKDIDSGETTEEVSREQEFKISKTLSFVEDEMITDNAGGNIDHLEIEEVKIEDNIKDDNKDQAATPEDDDFSFSDNEIEEAKPIQSESQDFFASFGDENATTGEASKDSTDDGWGNFATEDDHQAFVQESADDDFGDFDDFESATSVRSESQESYHILEELLRKVYNRFIPILHVLNNFEIIS